ncbi:SIMPL domain-containing protein [Candidatus Nitrospira neomarina]|uniref:SIMPL domain-containing protein n=1 Tax=Candidatus Nitrospira neomarina TaxID=3020899 RepID=A0AA96JVB0_9BACT|nr:SIMPL domain-containing protein [Candidatus Nitrospira neomarina]WNM60795.1 SIMPL domain-containing protein [Candidatus Nitrospira neomarina]
MSTTMNASTLVNGVVLGFLLLLLPVSGWAETNDEDLPRLTVSAEGMINVSPDKAVLSFAVETVGEKLSDVQQENQERVAKVLEECRGFNIPSEFIQTTSLNVIPEYPPPPRRPTDGTLENSVPRIIGYRVVHQVNVEVRNLEVVGKVVDRLLQVGANRFSGIAWGLQNEQPTKLEVLKQASAQAQSKAEALAQALNLKLVRMINVSEGGVSPSPPEGRYRMAMAMDSGGEASVSAGEISIRGSVLLVYEISQK